jgi:hypothetical protein
MICSIVTIPYKYNYWILLEGLPYMYVTINYNMYTICIRNTARSKSIPLLCTHVGSYKFSTVHPPRMNTRFKVFASYNFLQYLCDFIHVRLFVIVSKCRKSPKLTNIVIFPNMKVLCRGLSTKAKDVTIC